MREALALALESLAEGEVPVGAIVVASGEIVGRGRNLRESTQDPLGHAELMAIADAAAHLQSWRIPRSTLYVTLEPCMMCAGAIMQARIERVVFGTRDPKAGAVRSLYATLEDPRLPHRAQVIEGILQEECHAQLASFFRGLRGEG